MKKTFLPKKNFKLLFIFLGILFLWTEAAPKGRGGRRRRRRRGGRRSYQGYRGGGENPTAWVIILIVVVTLGFLACANYACIKVDDKKIEIKGKMNNNQYCLLQYPTAPIVTAGNQFKYLTQSPVLNPIWTQTNLIT